MGRKKKKSFMTPKAARRKARKRLSSAKGRAKKEFTYVVTQLKNSKHSQCGSEEDPSAPA